MFRFARKSHVDIEENTPHIDEPVIEKAALDRRKISGERVSCRCQFTLTNLDPFIHCKKQTSGVMVLNVRGCCVYPKNGLSLGDTKTMFPESQPLNIKKLVLTGEDGHEFTLQNLSIQRVRMLQDDHGDGIILKFINLSEQQLDLLNKVVNRYAE